MRNMNPQVLSLRSDLRSPTWSPSVLFALLVLFPLGVRLPGGVPIRSAAQSPESFVSAVDSDPLC